MGALSIQLLHAKRGTPFNLQRRWGEERRSCVVNPPFPRLPNSHKDEQGWKGRKLTSDDTRRIWFLLFNASSKAGGGEYAVWVGTSHGNRKGRRQLGRGREARRG